MPIKFCLVNCLSEKYGRRNPLSRGWRPGGTVEQRMLSLNRFVDLWGLFIASVFRVQGRKVWNCRQVIGVFFLYIKRIVVGSTA